jgi:hypothetical protein
MSKIIETREYPGAAPNDETTVFADVLDDGCVRFLLVPKVPTPGAGFAPRFSLGHQVLEQLADIARKAQLVVIDPVISCTVMQLAFVAWQRRRNPTAREDNLDLDLDPGSSSGLEFAAWWDTHKLVSLNPPVGGFRSIREACWEAWLAAPIAPTRDDSGLFEAWWQHDVVEAQPIVGP